MLDVVIGGASLRCTHYDTASGLFLSELPALAAGTYPVEVHGTNCSSFDAGLTVAVR